MSDRWKCPDCLGWVAPTVLVHSCTGTAASNRTNGEPVYVSCTCNRLPGGHLERTTAICPVHP